MGRQECIDTERHALASNCSVGTLFMRWEWSGASAPVGLPAAGSFTRQAQSSGAAADTHSHAVFSDWIPGRQLTACSPLERRHVLPNQLRNVLPLPLSLRPVSVSPVLLVLPLLTSKSRDHSGPCCQRCTPPPPLPVFARLFQGTV